MGQQTSALGADAQGQVDTYHVKVRYTHVRIGEARRVAEWSAPVRLLTTLLHCLSLLLFISQAWSPYLQWAGTSTAQLSQALRKLAASPAQLSANQLGATLGLASSVAAQLVSAWERDGARECIAPVLRTGVSSEDLLITLNMLLEDAATAAPDGSAPSLEGISGAQLEKFQEALDQIVEERGPEGEGVPIDGKQLQAALQRTLPLLQWAGLMTKLAQAVVEQGMGGDSASAAAPAAAAAAPARASAAASSSAPSRKAASSSSSSAASSSGGFGGGLDLSISGFSIKPPKK